MTFIKKGALVSLLFCLWPFLASAEPDPILTAVDTQVSYPDTDFSANYTVIQKKAGQGESVTKMAVFRRDSEDKYVMVLTAPDSDIGKGILRIGSNLWKYDPNSRRFDQTSAKDKFQNSDARFSDFNSSTLAKDYKVVSSGPETLGPFKTQVLSLEGLNDSVTFPKVKLWVTSDNLVRKREDFSLSGQLLRTSVIPSYHKYGNHSVPDSMVIQDELSGATVNGVLVHDQTTLRIANAQFGPLGDLTFSQGYLEKLRR